jgi:hypothetical protein
MTFANAGLEAALTKASLDQQVGQIVSQVQTLLHQASEMKLNFFDAHPDADFTAAAGGPGPTGYSAGDIATVKSSLADMNQLYQISIGSQALATAKNFYAFTNLIGGTDVL